MKVKRLDKNIVDSKPLPQIVREYILHDRGNSLYLGNSFENLPSPVHESATIKRLFKQKEDDVGGLKFKKKEDQEIRVEGKVEKKSPSQKKNLKFDIKELNKIVFEETKVGLKKKRRSYVEEDSYVNPCSQQPGLL